MVENVEIFGRGGNCSHSGWDCGYHESGEVEGCAHYRIVNDAFNALNKTPAEFHRLMLDEVRGARRDKCPLAGFIEKRIENALIDYAQRKKVSDMTPIRRKSRVSARKPDNKRGQQRTRSSGDSNRSIRFRQNYRLPQEDTSKCGVIINRHCCRGRGGCLLARAINDAANLGYSQEDVRRITSRALPDCQHPNTAEDMADQVGYDIS